jgi:hypothetical protein
VGQAVWVGMLEQQGLVLVDFVLLQASQLLLQQITQQLLVLVVLA